MAQWIGQYSGLTHETKVWDIEESLRISVKSLASAPESEREGRIKSVRHLSERLLAARLKVLNSRISAWAPLTERSKEIACLKAKENQLRSEGVDGILKEFSVSELISD